MLGKTAILAIAAPCDDKATVHHGLHGRIVLVAGDVGVDQDLGTHPVARGVVDLATDVIARTAIITTVVQPGNDITPILEACNVRVILVTVCRRVNEELTPHTSAIGVVALRVDAVVAAILVVRFPGNNKAAVVEGLDRRVVLGARYIGVDPELGNRLGAICIKDSRPHIVPTASPCPIIVAALVIAPGNDKATALESDNRRLVLLTRELGRINPELATNPHTRRIVELAIDVRVLTAIMTAPTVILPGDDKAATLKARNRGLIL